MKPHVFVFTTLLLTTLSSTPAADVNWQTPVTISGDIDVSLVGSLVSAANPGDTDVGDTTINGVTFTAMPLSGNPTMSSDGVFTIAESQSTLSAGTGRYATAATPYANLSVAYRQMLGPLIYSDAAETYTITANNLTIGQEYLFQYWANLSSADFGEEELDINRTISVISGNAVTLDGNTTNDNGGLGQFVIGAFVADATSQVFTVQADGGVPAVPPLSQGFQLRAIPEPATAVLTSLASFVLLGRRGRKGDK